MTRRKKRDPLEGDGKPAPVENAEPLAAPDTPETPETPETDPLGPADADLGIILPSPGDDVVQGDPGLLEPGSNGIPAEPPPPGETGRELTSDEAAAALAAGLETVGLSLPPAGIDKTPPPAPVEEKRVGFFATVHKVEIK